jgi:hypothetical protein
LPSSTGFAGPPSALRHGCAHPVGEGLAPPWGSCRRRRLRGHIGSLPACGEGSQRGAFPTGYNQRNIPSAVKRHFRQRCWLPARIVGRGTIALIGGDFICLGGDGGGGCFALIRQRLWRCHLQPYGMALPPRGGRLALNLTTCAVPPPPCGMALPSQRERQDNGGVPWGSAYTWLPLWGSCQLAD